MLLGFHITNLYDFFMVFVVSAAAAAAILATGEAEAEAMNKRAEGFARYNDAAVLQMLVEVLPKVAREVAAPMASIDRLTVVSTDGAGALPRQVTNNIVQTMELLKNTTGVDLEALLSGYLSGGLGVRGSKGSRGPTGSDVPAVEPTSAAVAAE